MPEKPTAHQAHIKQRTETDTNSNSCQLTDRKGIEVTVIRNMDMQVASLVVISNQPHTIQHEQIT